MHNDFWETDGFNQFFWNLESYYRRKMALDMLQRSENFNGGGGKMETYMID